jgi:hypothetical protein
LVPPIFQKPRYATKAGESRSSNVMANSSAKQLTALPCTGALAARTSSLLPLRAAGGFDHLVVRLGRRRHQAVSRAAQIAARPVCRRLPDRSFG